MSSNWNTRSTAGTRQEAMTLLVCRLTEFLDPRDYTNVDIDELQEFATKWALPYSAELFRQLKSNIQNELSGSWDSSNMNC